jgi:hypothetical protein
MGVRVRTSPVTQSPNPPIPLPNPPKPIHSLPLPHPGFFPMAKHSTIQIIGKRLLGAIPSVIGVIIVTFLLTRALPGDPAAFFAGPAATAEAIEEVRAQPGIG